MEQVSEEVRAGHTLLILKHHSLSSDLTSFLLPQVKELKSHKQEFEEDWPEIAYKIECLCQKEELLDKMSALLVFQAGEMYDECISLKKEIRDTWIPSEAQKKGLLASPMCSFTSYRHLLLLMETPYSYLCFHS